MAEIKRRVLGCGDFMTVPKVDLSFLNLYPSDEECAAIEREIDECSTKEKALAFIARVRSDPGSLRSWDVPYSLDEYERRILAGEFD